MSSDKQETMIDEGYECSNCGYRITVKFRSSIGNPYLHYCPECEETVIADFRRVYPPKREEKLSPLAEAVRRARGTGEPPSKPIKFACGGHSVDNEENHEQQRH